MKIISVQQPFAQLIVSGLKLLETRPWPTDYRGLLLIHASRSTPSVPSMVDFGNQLLRAHGHDPAHLVRGAIIGAAFINACYSARQWREHAGIAELINPEEERIGFFGPSYFAWHVIEPVTFPSPIPCPGQLGLWDPTPAQVKKIAHAIHSASM